MGVEAMGEAIGDALRGLKYILITAAIVIVVLIAAVIYLGVKLYG